MERPAFEGKVTLDVRGLTVREMIVSDGFLRAVPEAIGFRGETATLFNNVVLIASRIKPFSIPEGETDPVIVSAKSFIDFIQGNTDYRSIWEAFIDLSDLSVNNGFMNAINDDPALAPAEARPNTLTNEQLEEVGTEEAQTFLAQGANI